MESPKRILASISVCFIKISIIKTGCAYIHLFVDILEFMNYTHIRR